MALFSEYAVTPDVFNESCYDSPALCDAYFRQLLEVFLMRGWFETFAMVNGKRSFQPMQDPGTLAQSIF